MWVRAASECQPSMISPASMETTSPSASTWSPGIPCTTTSLTLMHSEAGKPW